MKYMVDTIKKNKLISFKTQKNISGIKSAGLLKKVISENKNSSKYNLIIVCTGNNSNLVKNFFNDQSLNLSYDEISITTIIKHDPLKNSIARQFFLNREIFALLPISNTETSIVWALKKKEAHYYKNKLLIKKQIKFYTKNFLKNIKFVSDIEFRDLNLLIRKKYYYERILIFGDALHAVHPLAGQGFNMTIRDLINLEKTLKNKISLGLDIGALDVLSEFSNTVKPRNFAYSIGVDFIKKFFSQDKVGLRNKIVVKLNKNNFVKNLFFDVADKGLKF
jgi:2-octaprenyl-6-methoxyphenol hydroxylase